MAQRVRRDLLDFRDSAEPGQASLGGRVMAVADIGREDIRAILASRLVRCEPGRRRPDRAYLSVALGIRKMDIALIGMQPGALQPLRFGDPKSRQENEAHGCQGNGTFTAFFGGPHGFSEPLDLDDTQASLLLFAGWFADLHRGVGLDHVEQLGMRQKALQRRDRARSDASSPVITPPRPSSRGLAVFPAAMSACMPEMSAILSARTCRRPISGLI